MKKTLICFAVLFCIVISMAGCTTSLSFTFNVETGDAIKVSLDTTNGYRLSSNVPFAISYEGETLTQGIFITADNYQAYLDAAESDSDAVILDSGKKDGNEYVFWSYNGEEFNYAILVGNSNTGILLNNNVSEESAKECFERLTLSVAD